MVSVRRALEGDAEFMVPLIAESSGGVWPAVWRALNSENQPAIEYAKSYLINPANKLGVGNAVIAEINDSPVGLMVTYQEDYTDSTPAVSPLPRSLVEALRPYRQLSDPQSLFIAEVCLLPDSRGKGVGTILLDFAKHTATKQGLSRVSLRVFSANTGAVRLYQKAGFEITGRRPVIAHPDIQVTGEVYLMSCVV